MTKQSQTRLCDEAGGFRRSIERDLRGETGEGNLLPMNDSVGTNAPWLVLMHQIPPKPDYFRVKVRRRLQRLGAVALKNSVYVLPAGKERAEDFAWLLLEIREEGGEAAVCEASFVAGISDDEVRGMFVAQADAGYAALAAAAARVADAEGGEPLAPLRRRLAELARLDFFGAPGREAAEAALAAAEERVRSGASPQPQPVEGSYRGRTWVTRAGVFVDRIASAWLIRRFIDPDARFRFVPERGYRPAPGEVRFDMFEGEFTHQADRCTFEVLLARFELRDAGLQAIGEIVHDVDVRDAKFARAEAAGIEAVLQGIALAHEDDAERLRAGGGVFDGLYAKLGGAAAQR